MRYFLFQTGPKIKSIPSNFLLIIYEDNIGNSLHNTDSGNEMHLDSIDDTDRNGNHEWSSMSDMSKDQFVDDLSVKKLINFEYENHTVNDINHKNKNKANWLNQEKNFDDSENRERQPSRISKITKYMSKVANPLDLLNHPDNSDEQDRDHQESDNFSIGNQKARFYILKEYFHQLVRSAAHSNENLKSVNEVVL